MWHRVADPEEVPEGTAKTVAAGGRLIALTRVGGQIGALDNVCPHKGGPLGQGAIEDGLLVCPWHGREYHPLTGQCEGYAESVASYPVELRDDGIYVEVGE
jgi:nitrite reductase/ring-hydroxylating ferredoxin subunit